MSDPHDWRHTLRQRDTLQTNDDLAAMVANLPHDRREALRRQLTDWQRIKDQSQQETASAAEFAKSLAALAPWVRADDRPLALRILRLITERR